MYDAGVAQHIQKGGNKMNTLLIVVVIVFGLCYFPIFLATLITCKCIWPTNIIVGRRFRKALIRDWNSVNWFLTRVSYSTATRVGKNAWEIYAEARNNVSRMTNNRFLFNTKNGEIFGNFIGDNILLKQGDKP